MAALKGRDSGSEDQQIDVLAQDSVGLEDIADSAWQRRDSQRRVPGRHMASQEGRRAGRRGGRPRRRLGHLVQSVCGSAWAALMLHIPTPRTAICSISPLFAAVREVWPGTNVQRCTFHVANQVKRCTTLKPKLEVGGRAPGHRQQPQGRRLRHGVAPGVQRVVH